MITRWVACGLVVGAALVASPAAAQRAVGEKPTAAPVGQVDQIEQQEQGIYPEMKRSALPLGAINKNWSSECGQDSTTHAVAYSPNKEIRFRVRQLLGTVVTFPEPVKVVSRPGGVAFSAEPHDADGGAASQVWVFGTTQAGLDSNYVFAGARRGAMPTLYLLHVQSEGYNTERCPDLMVFVKGPTAEDLDELASSLKAWISTMRRPATISPVAVRGGGEAAAAFEAKAESADEVETAAAADAGQGDLTGRQPVDWMASKPFDPSDLNFNWKVYGERSLAPDVVYSDCCFTYLKYDKDRLEWVRLGAVHAVENTSNGKIGAPVNWNMKGDTVVVQGVQALTLEREGLYACIRPLGHPADAPVGIEANERDDGAETVGAE